MPDEAISTTENNEAAAETSGDSTATEAQETSATEAERIEGEEALGDPGKKALDAMKAKWKEAEAKAKAEADARAALEAKLNGQEAEFKAAQEAQRIKDEAIAAANERILSAELRGAAKGKLADPADALTFIDLSSFEVGEDGSVDSSALEAAIDDLIKNKPYLAVQDGKRFQGGADAGARKESRPAQLSRSDLAGMSPEQIEAARREGRLNDLLGVK